VYVRSRTIASDLITGKLRLVARILRHVSAEVKELMTMVRRTLIVAGVILSVGLLLVVNIGAGMQRQAASSPARVSGLEHGRTRSICVWLRDAAVNIELIPDDINGFVLTDLVICGSTQPPGAYVSLEQGDATLIAIEPGATHLPLQSGIPIRARIPLVAKLHGEGQVQLTISGRFE
jgi:hypothetical protein